MSRAARGCGLIAGAVAVAAIVFVAVAIHQLGSTLHDPSPPDVAAVANSAPVVAADRLATTEIDTRLTEVARAGTGTALGPAAVVDQCQSRRGGMWVATWSPVACARTVTAYFTFNADFERQMQGWSAALAAQGWHGQGDPLAQPLHYYESMAGKRQPGNAGAAGPYLASDLPPSGELCKHSGPDDSVCLQFDWAERPRTRAVFLLQDAGPQTVVRQRHDVDPAQAESAAFGTDRYVAIVTLVDDYFKPSDKPSDKPTQTSNPDPSYTPCYSGSHNCY